MSTKVIVVIENGLVTCVHSNRDDLEIDVIDMDNVNNTDDLEYYEGLKHDIERYGYKKFRVY